jgi:hypothetical protein
MGEASPTKCAHWYLALLQKVKMFDAMYRAVARNGPSISAIKFQEMDTIAMVILEARDNIVAADGVTTDVENAVQWVSLTMMKLRQYLISSEDPSKQLNLKLIEIFKKSLNNLREKSLNENVKKSSHDGPNAIFDMIQGLVWEEEPEVVEEGQETYPAKQELLHDAIAEEETPPDDDKNDETQAANKSIFEMTGQHVLDEKLLEQDEVPSHSKEDFDEEPIDSKVTAMKPLQNFTESDETKKPTDNVLGEHFVMFLQDSVEKPMKPPQDLIEIIDETKTFKSNIQKESFFDIESEAALQKHDEREDDEANDVEAILMSPFDPGIKKEPIAEEKDVKKCSEIMIFEPKIQEFQLDGPSVVVCLRILFLFPDQRILASQLIFKPAQPAIQRYEISGNGRALEFLFKTNHHNCYRLILQKWM